MRKLGSRRGQSIVEYMLGISVIVIGLAAAFTVFGESVTAMFDNVRTTVQKPYP